MTKRTVLITGANRGLGLEFARQYLADGWHVIATCREPDAAIDLRGLGDERLEVRALEVTDFAAVDALADDLDGRPIDILINNAGLFGPKRKADSDLGQSFGHIDYDIWSEILRVNSQAPLKLSEALIDNVAASNERKIVTISSELGSIAGAEAGLYAYRTSKAAVNMAMAILTKDVAERGVTVITFNPGWVRTDMGGAEASLDANESITNLRKLIADFSRERSGAYLNYTGEEIPW